MNRKLFLAACGTLASINAAAAVISGSLARADEAPVLPIETPDPIAVVYLDMLSTPAPELPEVVTVTPLPVIREWNQDDVERLARLLWSSPLRAEQFKRELLWVVFNRIDDESSLFGADISTVVIKSEFTFFDKKAHLSEENIRIVTEELTRWENALAGRAERLLPSKYLYIRFSGDGNRNLDVLDGIGGNSL